MWALIFFSIFSLQDVPFKPKEDFDVKLDYQFKQRPPSDPNAVKFDETFKERQRRVSTDMLPYLILKIRMLRLEEGEERFRISNNMDRRIVNKKLNLNTLISLDLGFTDDVKDRVSPYEYTIHTLSPDKKELSRIVIFVGEDGSFYVNGEKRGKF